MLCDSIRIHCLYGDQLPKDILCAARLRAWLWQIPKDEEQLKKKSASDVFRDFLAAEYLLVLASQSVAGALQLAASPCLGTVVCCLGTVLPCLGIVLFSP